MKRVNKVSTFDSCKNRPYQWWSAFEMEVETENVTKEEIANENDEKVEQPNLSVLLSTLRRFQLYGTESNVYICSKNRSVNAFLHTERSNDIRIWKKSVKLKSVKALNNVCGPNSKNKERLLKWLLERRALAAPHTNAFIVAQLFDYHNLREVGMKLFPEFIQSSTDMFVFNNFYSKKGNQRTYKRQLYKWYNDPMSAEKIKDVVLVKSLLGWTHKDVLKLWHLPAKSALMQLLCDEKNVNYDSIEDEEVKQLIMKSAKLRGMKCAKDFIEFFSDKENITQFRNYLLIGLKSQFCMESTITEAIKNMELNDVIEFIPKVFNRYPNNCQLAQQFVDRFQRTDGYTDLNPMSLFVVYKWLEYVINIGLVGAKQKAACRVIRDKLIALLCDVKVKQIDNLLFILDIEEEKSSQVERMSTDDEMEKRTKIKKTQDLKRAPINGTIIKPLEFLAFLFEKYHSHKVYHDNKLIHLKGNFSDIHANLKKWEPSMPMSWPLSYNNIIYVTVNKPLSRDVDSWLKKFETYKFMAISITKQNKFRSTFSTAKCCRRVEI
ncbi:hypothetical protein B4U80_13609 [Leptotrombidium deliense]|uniref:Uncharacterized protein n=1 Tax=Leptotrombidium deliense TaxID=299467 RepID=A0A443SU18_9ACAR|nr:hypothetical protein B4U80_13609 [Leptotrombidium deliense]